MLGTKLWEETTKSRQATASEGIASRVARPRQCIARAQQFRETLEALKLPRPPRLTQSAGERRVLQTSSGAGSKPPVVNDGSERETKHNSEFSGALTKDEEGKQRHLLHPAEAHRRLPPRSWYEVDLS